MQPDLRRPVIAGNWKMHGTLALARDRARTIRSRISGGHVEVWLAPPFVHIPAVLSELDGSSLSVLGQDASRLNSGPCTGDIAAEMLADLGCRGVLVGHSERRAGHGESDEVVAEKVLRVLEARMFPVLCVGETLNERQAGLTEAVVQRQLQVVLDQVPDTELHRLVLAYEPVWAIGTGQNATPEQAQQVHAFLREQITRRDSRVAEKLRILYGGSVRAANAGSLFSMPDIDGALVGGASLDANEFLEICAACADLGD